MIQANELRIGNYVCDNWGVVRVDIITENGINLSLPDCLYEIDYIKTEGIQLTEEILLKCGFERIDHIGGYSFWSLKRKRREGEPSIDIYNNKTMVNGHYAKHLEYLHQLQNLYFCLTGKELEVKL